MKKFIFGLLILVLLLSPFTVQAVDIGNDCIDRDTQTSADSMTYIDSNTTASVAGTITAFCIYWNSATGGNVRPATFDLVSEDTFTARARSDQVLGVSQGENLFSAPGDFAAFEVQIGDYLGVYAGATGDLEVDNGGVCWYCAGDQTECSEQGFTDYTKHFSFSGTITETAGGSAQIIIIGN